MTVAVGLAAFAGGVWLLVESVEGLVDVLARWALAAGLSGVALAALVLGFDLESTAAGIAATLEGLPGTALGTSIGASIFLLTLGLGLAAATAPFSLATPRRAVIAAVLAALLAVALTLDGSLSRRDGAALVIAFPPLLALLVTGRQPREPSGTRPDRLALRLGAGLAGLLVGAELLVFGVERTVEGLGVSETLFGLVVVGAAVSLPEIVLELLPAYRGQPETSIGNALGTLVFLLTASPGAIALVSPIEVPASVRSYHAPALLASVALLAILLLRGRMGRPEGAVLLGAYAAYGAGALLVS